MPSDGGSDVTGATRLRHTACALALGLSVAGSGSAAPPVGKQSHSPPPPTTLPPLTPAQIDDTLGIEGEKIDARKVRTRMTVAVGLNGRGPYRFVVDSGADTSVVGARAAAALAMPAGTPIILNGMTERSYVARVMVAEMTLGQATFRDRLLPVLKEGDLGGDGMIGIDALTEQRLMLDFEKRTITVEDAARPTPRFDGEIVVVARRRRGQLILTQVQANNRPIEAVIDTGSELTIGNSRLRERLFGRKRNLLTKISITGVTGVTVDLDLAILRELKLGPVVLQNVPIAFADVPPFAVFGLAETPSLLLGTDLMENFRRVSLDFGKRKVRFQLKRCEATSVLISTSPIGGGSRIGTTADGQVACRR